MPNRTISNSISFLKARQGGAGPRGKIGRFFYYAGAWNDFASTDSFLVNDAQAPYFAYNSNYWVFNPETNGTYTKQDMGTPSSSSSSWKLMTNDFKYIITEAIFGGYAHFGSAIINGDWLISGNGTINGTLYKNGDDYNNNKAYTWFDPLFPYGVGNANIEIAISTINWNYNSGSDIRRISSQFTLKANRTYVIKILCHVERTYAALQQDTYPEIRWWCPKDGVIDNNTLRGMTDVEKGEDDQVIQNTITPTSDGVYDIRAGLNTPVSYGYGYITMIVVECQTNTMFVPKYCVDLLSGESSMAGGKVQANKQGDFFVKGGLMFSSLAQDLFGNQVVEQTTSKTTYNYTLQSGVYDGNILMPKIKANYFVINGNMQYDTSSYNYNFYVDLPPAILFEGMEITIIINARSSSNSDLILPITLRVPAAFDAIAPIRTDSNRGITWNRFAVIYPNGRVAYEVDWGTYLKTDGANVIKLVAMKHPLVEYYNPQEQDKTKCIAWCVVDVK